MLLLLLLLFQLHNSSVNNWCVKPGIVNLLNAKLCVIISKKITLAISENPRKALLRAQLISTVLVPSRNC